jgi:hypothetical protein
VIVASTRNGGLSAAGLDDLQQPAVKAATGRATATEATGRA